MQNVYIITYKGKPATRGEIHKREGKAYGITEAEADRVFASKKKSALIAEFIYMFGFTFPEWAKEGYAVATVQM